MSKGFAVIQVESYVNPIGKKEDGSPRDPFTTFYYLQGKRSFFMAWSGERDTALLFDTRKQATNFIRDHYPQAGVGKLWPMYRHKTDRAEGKPPHRLAGYRVMPVELSCVAI